MKILSIAGQNLASLKDEFLVHFYEGPLKQAGLFSICGKTGAGKTTLFDAMCLALFAQTPRLHNNRTKVFLNLENEKGENLFYSKLDLHDPLQIITRGETKAYAQVLFIVKGHTYRVRWEVVKKRKNLEHIHRLFKVETEGLEEEYIPDIHTLKGKQKEILGQIEKVIGLSFEQFKRAVLLAQGEFAQFLKASSNEKSELLEKITGSEIYSSLAQNAHVQFKEFKKKKEELVSKKNSLIIKSEEEIFELQNSIKNLQDFDSELEKKQQILLEDKAWHERRDLLSKEQQEYEFQIEQLTTKKDEIEKKSLQLQKIKFALPLQPLFFQLEKQAQILLTVQNDLLLEENKQKKILTQKEEIEAKVSTHKEKLALFLEEKNSREECILSCEILDNKIKDLDENILKQKREIVSQQNELDTLLKKINLQTDEEKKAMLSVQEQEAWLEENNFLEKINTNQESIFKNAEEINAIFALLKKDQFQFIASKSLFEQHQELLENLVVIRQHRENTFAKMNALCASRAENFQDDVLFALQTKLTLVSEFAQKKQFVLEKKRQRNVEEEHFKQLADSLLAVQTEHTNLLQNFETKEKELVQLNQDILILSAASDVASKRSLLLALNKPCPLCGSLEHPLAGESYSFAEPLQKLLREKEELEQNQKKNKQILKELEVKNVSLQKDYFTQKQKIGEIVALEEKAMEEMQHIASNLNHSELCRETAQENLLAFEAGRLFTELKQELLQKQELKKIFDDLELDCKESQQKEQMQKEFLHSLEKMKQCEDFLKQNIPDKKYFLENILNHLDIFKANIKKSIDLFLKKQEQFKSFKENLEQIKLLKNSLQGQCQEKEEQKIILCKNKEETEKEYRFNMQARQTLLPNKNTKDYRNEMNLEETSLKTTLEVFTEQSKTLEIHFRTSQTTQEILTSRLQHLCKENEFLHQEYVSKWQGLGFINEEEVSSFFKFSEEIIINIEQDIQNYKEKLNHFTLLLEKLEKELQALLSQERTQKNHTEVLQSLSDLSLQNKENQGNIGKLRQILTFELAQLENFTSLQKELLLLEPSYQTWEKMIKAIGDASGKSFRTFAQNITLDILLSRANYHLSELRPRYRLERIPEADMEIRIIDLQMGGEMRGIYSLSGGESFLVSLSLALALSSLSSKNIFMECLFIDEGFGTLDSDTLETAIHILDGLQAQGRKVGIISHVESLNEKIGYQIQIREKGGGYSQVVV